MQFSNTLTRQVAPFVPRTPGEVTLYTCGPTVYDYAHIGNLRAFIFDDTLRRTLEAAGYDVRHVINITDVGHLSSDGDEGEDKLEKGSAREGKTAREIADRYTEAFKADAAALNILEPNAYYDEQYHDSYARATRFIDAQIEMVRVLIERGHAYVTEQAIYFDITSISDYGALTGQSLGDKEVAVRSEVITDPAKHHPYDFAVWFFTVGHFTDHSMRWPSPWGDGFPGWHLECSAIIHELLGDPIDIHTGGVDHIGTHHTNELAQTQGAYGHALASIWMHNEFVMVEGRKMAKSEGTGYTVADLRAHGFEPIVLRMLVLQAHYRSELNFSWESMAAARNTLMALYDWADLVHQPELLAVEPNSGADELLVAIQTACEDDLNTPAALAHLFRLIDTPVERTQLVAALTRLEAVFGLKLTGRSAASPELGEIMAQREVARRSQDWGRSDELRAAAHELGYRLEDTAAGQRWRRTGL